MTIEKQSEPRKSRFGVPAWIRIAVSAGLLAYLLNKIEIEKSLGIISDARLDLLIVALLLVVVMRVLAAYRWYVFVRAMQVDVPFWTLLRYTFVSSFLGFFMPGTVGVELVRVYSLSRATSNLAMAFSSVLLERLFSFLAVILLVLVGLASAPPGLPPAIAQAAWVGLMVLVGATIAISSSRLRSLSFAFLPGRQLAPARDKLRKLYANLDACRRRPYLMIWAVFIAVAFQALRVIRLAVGAAAVGIQFPFLYFMIFTPMALFISQIPISIAGLGVREGSFVYLFGLGGMTAEAAFIVSLISFTYMILETLPGAVLYAAGERKRLRERRDQSLASSRDAKIE